MLSFDDYERLLGQMSADYVLDTLEEAEDYERAARYIYATHLRNDLQARHFADKFRDRARAIRAYYKALKN